MTNIEQSYKNTTHKVNLTGEELSTILYCLEGYVAGLDDVEYDEIANTNEQQDQKLVNTVDRIVVELQSVTDNYYAQLEEQSNNIMVLNHTSIHNKHWKDYNVQNNKEGH